MNTTLNLWNQPIIFSELFLKNSHNIDYLKNIYKIQPTDEFVPFSIPFLLVGDTKENPTVLPNEYKVALEMHSKRFETFRKKFLKKREKEENKKESKKVKKIEKKHELFERKEFQAIKEQFGKWLKSNGYSRQLKALVNMQLDTCGTDKRKHSL